MSLAIHIRRCIHVFVSFDTGRLGWKELDVHTVVERRVAVTKDVKHYISGAHNGRRRTIVKLEGGSQRTKKRGDHAFSLLCWAIQSTGIKKSRNQEFLNLLRSFIQNKKTDHAT